MRISTVYSFAATLLVIVALVAFAWSPAPRKWISLMKPKCAIVIPPSQISRVPTVQVIYRNELFYDRSGMRPGFIVLADNLDCE